MSIVPFETRHMYAHKLRPARDKTEQNGPIALQIAAICGARYGCAMSKVVNLRLARKQAIRAQKRSAATVRAAQHGRSAAQKALEKTQAEKSRRELDGHERDA